MDQECSSKKISLIVLAGSLNLLARREARPPRQLETPAR